MFYASSAFAAVDINVRIALHGWLVLELSDDSEFWVGIFALVLGIGQLLFSMVAGAIVDRFQRRNVLLAEGALSATVASGLAVVTYLGAAELWMAIAIALLIGCQRALRFTAANRFVFDIVGSRHLINGVALWRLAATPMVIFGALLAGALIDWTGLWSAFAFMAASLIVSLPLLALIHVSGEVSRSSENLLHQTLEGVRFAARNPSLRTLFSISVVMELLGFAFLIMIPIMAKNVLEVGGTGMGWLQAGVGAGMLLASLLMASLGDVENKARIIFFMALGAGLALIGFALSRSLVLSVAMAAATMAFLNAYDLTLGALMQLVSPPELRGRAVSLHSLAISFTALGGFIMGVVGGIVGVPLVMAVGGGGIVLNSLLRRGALASMKEHVD
jgi:MFS family permease